MRNMATATEMTPKAAEAFQAYVGLGPSRSIRRLADVLVQQGLYKNSTAAHRVLAKWSVDYGWQERLAAAVTAKTEEILAKAAEIDAATFARSSQLLAKRMGSAKEADVDVVVKIRETVRRPEPRGASAQVNLNLQVTMRELVEQIAAEQGLSVDEVLAEAEAILRERP
jgi:hypothetical protein